MFSIDVDDGEIVTFHYQTLLLRETLDYRKSEYGFYYCKRAIPRRDYLLVFSSARSLLLMQSSADKFLCRSGGENPSTLP